MPDVDGFELYKELRRVDSKLKVCFLTTSEVFYEGYRQAQYPRIDEHWPMIQKPIANEELNK